MAGTDLNPPLLPSSYGNHIPSKTYPSLKPYTSSNYTTDMVQVNGPSYQSNNHAASIDRSRHQPHSPCNRLGSLASMGHAQRRKSSNSNSIASYLQIPSSINNSKGSLAEFAAQITCLFWFESSFTLHRVEEAKNTPIPTTPLVSDAMPSSGFLKWVTTILSTTQVTQNVILLALMFIYRLKNLNPTVKGKPGSEFRLLTVALMLGNKFLDDNTYTNKTWAEVSGISVQEIHIMEVEFLSNMRYSLFTSDQEWQEWHVKLGRFWNYFDKASRSPVEVAPRSLGPPTPALHMPPPLPSPPASTHASPPYMTTYSPTNSSYPHPFAVPAYFAPHLPSPASQMSEGDLRPTGRKRSHEDHMQEPPAKRITRPVAPSPASSLTLPPSTTPGVTSHMPRLPVPNLSISTSQPMHNFGSHTSTHLPPPAGRADQLLSTNIRPLVSGINATERSKHQSSTVLGFVPSAKSLHWNVGNIIANLRKFPGSYAFSKSSFAFIFSFTTQLTLSASSQRQYVACAASVSFDA
ncbi:MAG: hypothetical protein M1827_006356 [Pycnora praestabilis]|nr:MAG: hypothetical protein M1827_006356 [Pycnora praestabilis]